MSFSASENTKVALPFLLFKLQQLVLPVGTLRVATPFAMLNCSYLYPHRFSQLLTITCPVPILMAHPAYHVTCILILFMHSEYLPTFYNKLHQYIIEMTNNSN